MYEMNGFTVLFLETLIEKKYLPCIVCCINASTGATHGLVPVQAFHIAVDEALLFQRRYHAEAYIDLGFYSFL
jgi:hypothetical protein